jgi:hypothetical protein
MPVEGLNLSKNISIFAPFKIFDSSGRIHNDSSNPPQMGQLVDPYTGDSFEYSNADEYHDALTKLEENRKKLQQEQLRAMLLIASSGTPDAVERIFKGTKTITKDGQELNADEHAQAMEAAVYDAVKASASSMSLSQLKAFAAKYSSLSTVLEDRMFKIKQSGLGLNIGQEYTGENLDRIISDRNRFSVNVS